MVVEEEGEFWVYGCMIKQMGGDFPFAEFWSWSHGFMGGRKFIAIAIAIAWGCSG